MFDIEKKPTMICFKAGKCVIFFIYLLLYSRRALIPKHEKKLREKIVNAYGEKWNHERREKNIKESMDNVKSCMEHRDLVGVTITEISNGLG